MSSGPSYLRQLWYKWKTLKLPWRRQFLAGADLTGNTFWEFRDAINAGRWRRIVKYPIRVHHADVKISRMCTFHAHKLEDWLRSDCSTMAPVASPHARARAEYSRTAVRSLTPGYDEATRCEGGREMEQHSKLP